MDDGEDLILEMKDITVRFPGVLALDNVSFQTARGEVHVLLGENGAGKSTLMKVLAGVNTHYEGTIYYKGEEIVARSVQEQQDRGISIIFQEMNSLPNLTVAENIFLGREPVDATGTINWSKMYKDARELLDMIHSNISEKALVGSLTVGQAQMVEIAKALSFKSDIIIMDEPTSALTEKEVDALFEIIHRLQDRGVAIIYISHRLEEILEIGDQVTIFRDGKNVTSLPIKGLTTDKMVSLMVGRDMDEYYPKVEVTPGKVKLEVRDLVQGDRLKGVSFKARAGEITGFYGLMGAGRTELMRCVFGADPYTSGEIYVDEKLRHIDSCQKAKKLGIALLTEDRKTEGLILEFDLNSNISLTNFRPAMTPWGLSDKREGKNSEKFAKLVKVKTPSLKQLARNLSGGNQQKVVIAKWLNADSDIVIFDEPTRGIDVGAKVEIYRIINGLKEAGKSIIVVSSDLVECMGISDKIYVMHEGKITGLIEGDQMKDLSEEQIISYATGANQPGKEKDSNPDA